MLSITRIVFFTVAAGFHTFSFGQGPDAKWSFESQRPEIAPLSSIDKKVTFDNKPTLLLRGGGKEYAAGYWYKVVKVKPETFYHFRTHFTSESVDEPSRTVLARVVWQNEAGNVVGFREYPATQMRTTQQGWSVIEQSYKAPKEAASAKLELHYRWDADGSVHFGETTFI